MKDYTVNPFITKRSLKESNNTHQQDYEQVLFYYFLQPVIV